MITNELDLRVPGSAAQASDAAQRTNTRKTRMSLTDQAPLALRQHILGQLHGQLPKLIVSWPRLARFRRLLLKAYERAVAGELPEIVVVRGESRVGKSVLVCQAAIDIINACADPKTVPVIKFTMPTSGNEKALYAEFLAATHHPSPWSHTRNDMFDKVKAVVHRLRPKMLIIDEAQHAARGKPTPTVYYNGDVIKRMGDELRIPIVLVGCKEIDELLRLNPQLRNRARTSIRIKAFDWNNPKSRQEFLDFLRLLDDSLPFEYQSELAGAALAVAIFRATEGYIGIITQLVRHASDLAELDGAVRVEPEHLEQAFADLRQEYVAGAANPFTGLLASSPKRKARLPAPSPKLIAPR